MKLNIKENVKHVNNRGQTFQLRPFHLSSYLEQPRCFFLGKYGEKLDSHVTYTVIYFDTFIRDLMFIAGFFNFILYLSF